MCEDAVQAERTSMVHESQDLVVPSPDQPSPSHSLTQLGMGELNEASKSGAPEATTTKDSTPGAGVPGTGPVNAITVLTLLDKLVNMLDTVQENQHKMEVRQAEMEGAVRGIQADMTKLSKSHTHTSNTVSKLLDKSRKVSVTMKEVRDRMERQAGQVKKLEANHSHLLKRNNFKVLIFQEENEIPSSVFVKDPIPTLPEEGEEPAADADANHSMEEGLHTIDLSSDEDVGLEAEQEEGDGLHDLVGDPIEKSRTDKFKRSSLKKVDSLKRAFSKANIEKKMNKIVSQEKREKIKKSLTPSHQKSPGGKSSSFKVSPLTFGIKKNPELEGHHPEAEAEAQVSSQTAVASIELSPLASPDEEASFHEVHSQLAPGLEESKAEADSLEAGDVATSRVLESVQIPEFNGVPDTSPFRRSDIPETDMLVLTEGVSEEYALSATLPQDISHTSSAFVNEDEEEIEMKVKEMEASRLEEEA
ncbi:caveolae-associated protein 2b [Esox lucius]|uniref:Caveolae associated protein 2b n=1 Tax=Esox lucius TaxID=8010 RepID=A0A3P8XBB8_ESOLU|nr:caveolae-associated protein 2b [Esox lucius]